MMAHKKKLFALFLLMASVLAIAWITVCQSKDNLQKNKAADLNYLPSGKFLRVLTLGYDEAFADLVWVRIFTYFGEQSKSDQDYTWLGNMINISTELDPKFLAPYEFGGMFLAAKAGRPDEAIELLKRGIENVPKTTPRYWLQPFYLGYNYITYKNDPLNAARYLELAASFPESPDFLPLLIARLYADADNPDLGLAFIREILKNSNKGYLRESLERRARELMATKHILFLEQAMRAFHKANGRHPHDLNELVSGKIIKGIPKEPLGGTYYISKGGEVMSSTIGGKLKVYKPGS